MNRLPIVSLLLLASLACAGAARADGTAAAPSAPPPALESAAAAAATHAFEGIWMFDAKRSDDPRKVMEGSRSGAGRRPEGGMGRGGMPPGGMEGGRGGMGPRGGRGGPPGEAPEGGDEGEAGTNSRAGGDSRRAMERVFHPPAKMVVYVDRDRFQVEEDEGAPRRYTIADSLKAQGVNALEDEATVRMRGRALEAKQPLGRRGALLETFELSEDGRTLTIRARRQGGPEGMPNPTFTRVYVKYEGE